MHSILHVWLWLPLPLKCGSGFSRTTNIPDDIHGTLLTYMQCSVCIISVLRLWITLPLKDACGKIWQLFKYVTLTCLTRVKSIGLWLVAGFWTLGTKLVHWTYLCDKHPEEQYREVPGEEEEGATDPQVVQHGKVQQPCYAVQRVQRAGEKGIVQLGPSNEKMWRTYLIPLCTYNVCVCY